MSSIQIATDTNWPTLLYDCDNGLANDEVALAAARARLAASHLQYEQNKPPRNEIYYPGKRVDEEQVRDFVSSESLDAVVTRNHYGSLVLNAHYCAFHRCRHAGIGQSIADRAPHRGAVFPSTGKQLSMILASSWPANRTLVFGSIERQPDSGFWLPRMSSSLVQNARMV